MYSNEINTKLARVEEFLQKHQLDGVLLQNRASFAWITGGRDNHIVSASESGVASILVTPGKLLCLTNHIESPRFRTEELLNTGIDVVDYPWWDHDAAARTVREVFAGRNIASDTRAFGLSELPSGFSQLRW